MQFTTTYNSRKAHGIDHYQIKNNSNIIYGDKNINEIIKDNIDIIYVIGRTLYTIKTRQIGTKAETSKYLADTYPNLKSIIDQLTYLYKNEPQILEIKKDDFEDFLFLADQEMEAFCKG